MAVFLESLYSICRLNVRLLVVLRPFVKFLIANSPNESYREEEVRALGHNSLTSPSQCKIVLRREVPCANEEGREVLRRRDRHPLDEDFDARAKE